MANRKFRFLISSAFLGVTVTIGASAQAYWGGPWGGPGRGPAYGYGHPGPADLDRTHQRQSRMRDHRAAMQDLGNMLSGRRNFNRVEAVQLAREIEASSGENLVAECR